MLQIKMLYKLLRDHQDVKVGYCQMEDRVGFLQFVKKQKEKQILYKYLSILLELLKR